MPRRARPNGTFDRVQSRPFLTVDARVEVDNATDEVIRAIARHGDAVRDAVVRLRIEIPPERVGELHDETIRAQLKSAYYLTPIERIVRQRARDRWGADAAAIQRAAPLDALAYTSSTSRSIRPGASAAALTADRRRG